MSAYDLGKAMRMWRKDFGKMCLCRKKYTYLRANRSNKLMMSRDDFRLNRQTERMETRWLLYPLRCRLNNFSSHLFFDAFLLVGKFVMLNMKAIHFMEQVN